MRVEFTGRHIEVSEPLRQFALDRLERIRSLPDILEVHFVLSVEKHRRHVAEIKLKTRNGLYHCVDTTSDIYTSIASVLEKLESQVQKPKTRKTGRRRSAANSKVVDAGSIEKFEPEVTE